MLRSKRNIRNNATPLLQWRDAKLGSGPEALKKFAGFFVQRCYQAAVSRPNQQSAYRVFSVLNSQALDLLPTDIITADVIGRACENRREHPNDKWEAHEDLTARDGFVALFGHIRVQYARNKAKRLLLEEFREYVLTAISSPEDVVSKIIEPYADAYLIAKGSIEIHDGSR